MDEKELIAKAELGTYLDGLKDAQYMTTRKIKQAIKIIIESNDEF